MPTYSYVCDACEHTLELYQGILEKKLKKCPKCGKMKFRREIGRGSSVHFRGDGWAEVEIHGRRRRG